MKEFHAWWPPLRVAILHDSGSHVGKRDALIRSVNQSRGVLITSYTGIVQHKDQLLRMDWDYVILDEGHKIRNPDAQVRHSCSIFYQRWTFNWGFSERRPRSALSNSARVTGSFAVVVLCRTIWRNFGRYLILSSRESWERWVFQLESKFTFLTLVTWRAF